MAFWTRPSIGLDIGSRVVKAVQLKKAGKKVTLERCGVAEIYPGAEKPSDPAAQRRMTVEAIRNALAAGDIKATQALTAVAGESIIVRYIHLPVMPEDELKNALRWEAEEYIPFRIDDVNIDSAIIGRTVQGDDSRMKVLLVCARKDLISDHVDLVTEAGLRPICIDVDSFSFLNCFDASCPTRAGEVVALVNIGGDISSISVFCDGMPHFSRDISIGGSTITAAIQQRLDIPVSDAETLKSRVGAPGEESVEELDELGVGEDEDNLMDTIRSTVEAMTGEEETSTEEAAAERAIRNTLNNLVSEVKRSIQFFENQETDMKVGRLVIGGGTASLSGLPSFFERETGLPVEIINPLASIDVNTKTVDPAWLEQHRNSLTVGIGLALRKVVG